MQNRKAKPKAKAYVRPSEVTPGLFAVVRKGKEVSWHIDARSAQMELDAPVEDSAEQTIDTPVENN